jgi:branched-chain amino acid transport system ATP-binding protein
VADALLRVEGLVKRYGGVTATDHASLAIERGEIHALIGPNGAGKTTLVSQVAGEVAPDEGRILLEGRDIGALAMHERVALGLARSFQVTSIFGRLSVLDNLALAVQAANGSSWRFWRPAIRERALFDGAREIAARVGLEGLDGVAARTLPHGRQRQLELGLALATRPRVLLLDEPTAGMGPEESARMASLLDSLRGTTTLLLVEHDMPTVFRLADRISVLVYGRVIATGTPGEIRANREVRDAYLGGEVA